MTSTLRIHEPLIVYQWDDGLRLSLEPAGSWSDKLQKNVVVWYLLLHREDRRVLCRLQPKQESGKISIPGPSESVEKELQAHGAHLRGFLLDVGVRPVAGLLFSEAKGFVLPFPRFIADELWDDRYSAAERYVRDQGKTPSRDPFLGVVRGLSLSVVATRVDDPSKNLWVARGNHDRVISTMKPFRETVDRVVEDGFLFPARRRATWEEENIRRGTWVAPTAGELEVFSLLGEPLPFFWDTEKLYAWYLERVL